MELKQGDIIQILNKGNNCVLLLVLNATAFNADNKKPIEAWNSFFKRKEKVWIEPLWSSSAIEVCVRHGKIKPYLPEIVYIGEWASYQESEKTATIAITHINKLTQ